MANPMVQPDPTKVVGRRVVAVLLDAVLVIVPAILLVTASFEYIEVDDLPVSAERFCDQYLDEVGGACINAEDVDDRVYFSEDSNAGSTAFYWVANLLILVLLQGLTGWTPGKLLTGIRVVREDGQRPGIVKALLRWLLWFVDGFPWFIPGLTGFIVALSTPGHRRVGDMVARTFVVRRSAAGTPITLESGRLVVGDQVGAPYAWTPPPGGPAAPVAPTGWGQTADPSSAGWASPGAAAPSAPAAPAPSADGPQWDAARGTYIQWDPTQRLWMQWDEATKAWSQIPGQ